MDDLTPAPASAGIYGRVAALVPNILGFTPGQRFRIESWACLLREAGWTVDFYPFEDARLHEVLYRPGHRVAKTRGLLSCYLRHLALIRRRPPCDLIFIYREAALVGPAVLERFAARMGVPIVYDIDDPVFLPYKSPTSGWFSLLKCPGKTRTLMRLSDRVIAINDALAGYARRLNRLVSVIPNFVDTERYRPAPRSATGSGATPRFVWMGSRSTIANLRLLAEPLQRLQGRCPAAVRIVGVGDVPLTGVQLEFRPWSVDTEVADLQDCDVGLAPIPDVPWNKWKFFLKVVQYMAVGLPVVASRVGSNAEVIEDGVNGFLAGSAEEWTDRLHRLATDEGLRRRMSAAARETAQRRFSVEALRGQVVSTFESVLRDGRRPKR
jgi:glycosyltransferase involved in cell wall biosynthesis